jgi:hypothetical protein
MTDREERIREAANVLSHEYGRRIPDGIANVGHLHVESLARLVADIVDPPSRPPWPSDESVSAFRQGHGFAQLVEQSHSEDSTREALREALLVDPIIQAAIECRDNYKGVGAIAGAVIGRLATAVNRAGL